MPHGGLYPWLTFHAWVTMVRNKWLGLYYSTYWCYIHQTCTNCLSWHDLLMPHGGLCPWPTFHAWVTMVRKKWLSLYYSTYGCYIHKTYINCSSWHDLLMPHGDLCSWPTFHASVTKTQNGNSVFSRHCFYAPSLKGPPGASSNQIVRLSVHLFVRLSARPSVRP